ncbi:MAG: hypothetical protein KJO25_07645 [Bacteroidia bacterium]|nr:hypothetical protein [Bacteroidia bacterium]
MVLLIISFAPFLFIKELPPGNNGQLQGLFSLIWTIFTMIPAILITAAGFIIWFNTLIQSVIKIHTVLGLGISALVLSLSSIWMARLLPEFDHSMLNLIIELVLGFFRFFLFYPSIIAIVIGIILTLVNRKNHDI